MKTTFLPWIDKQREKINWETLSLNINAISILEDNLDKIHWRLLSLNKGRMEINYLYLKERMDILREDLMKIVFHPSRLEYYLSVFDYNIFEDAYSEYCD